MKSRIPRCKHRSVAAFSVAALRYLSMDSPISSDQLDRPRPLMIFDGDCSLCCRWIARWKKLTAGAIDYEPYQVAADRFPAIGRAAFGRAVYLIEVDGTTSRAAHAVFKSLALAGKKRYLLWLYKNVPPVKWAAELGYWLIARNRGLVDRIDRLTMRSGDDDSADATAPCGRIAAASQPPPDAQRNPH